MDLDYLIQVPLQDLKRVLCATSQKVSLCCHTHSETQLGQARVPSFPSKNFCKTNLGSYLLLVGCNEWDPTNGGFLPARELLVLVVFLPGLASKLLILGMPNPTVKGRLGRLL